MKSEYCSTKIDEKQVFLTLTKGHKQNCPEKTELVFIGKEEMSKISDCAKRLTFLVKDIKVLEENKLCKKFCLQNSCTLLYQIDYGKYKAICKSKSSQQKKFQLCQKIAQKNKKSKNDLNLNVVALVVLVFIVSIAVSILSILYRRQKTINTSEPVS